MRDRVSGSSSAGASPPVRGGKSLAARFEPDSLAVVVYDPLHRSVQADVDTHLAGDIRHSLRDGAAAADRVKHAVLVFEKREDREQARALERRHAEIFRLE